MALSDTLQDAEDSLEEGEELVDSAPGPLSEPARSALATRLTTAEAKCNTAMAHADLSGVTPQLYNTYPSANTLPAIAADCVSLAGDAKDEEATRGTGWDFRCKSNLHTIKHLITMANGYRAKAGIT